MKTFAVKLSILCSEYPDLYRYGMLMEEAAEAESKKAKTAYGHLPEWPDSVKATVAQLLTDGTTFERGLQTILNEQGQRDMWLEIEIMEGITSIGWLNTPNWPTSHGLQMYPKNLAR